MEAFRSTSNAMLMPLCTHVNPFHADASWTAYVGIVYCVITFGIIQGYASERIRRCGTCGLNLPFVKAFGCEEISVSFLWPLALFGG